MPSSQAAFQAPSLGLLVTEPLRAMLEFCTAHLGQPPAFRGDGHAVVVYPGLGAGAFNTTQLRSYLKNCNFAVYDWELGVNRGPDGELHGWLDGLVQRVQELRTRHEGRVSLVGWSLGGVYAREIAKLDPDSVRQVITLATPFSSMAEASHAQTIFKMMGGDTSSLTPELLARLRARPPVPTTSVYSKSDGLVCWQGCLEERGPRVENVEVEASHLGMTTHPEVLRVVANRLAQPEGQWKPYRRARASLRRATGSSRSRK